MNYLLPLPFPTRWTDPIQQSGARPVVLVAGRWPRVSPHTSPPLSLRYWAGPRGLHRVALLLLLLAGWLSPAGARAQLFSREEILHNNHAPEFAKLSVAPNANFYKVVAAFHRYEATHPEPPRRGAAKHWDEDRDRAHEAEREKARGKDAKPLPPRAGKAEEEEEENTDIWRFYFQRWVSQVQGFVRPDGHIGTVTDSAAQRYLRERQRAPARPAKATGAPSGPQHRLNGSGAWQSLGPKVILSQTADTVNESGNIYGLTFNETSPKIGYCGSETGYVFKTTNGGNDWALVGTNMIFPTGVRALATAPNNPDVVYAGSGDLLYRSLDGGTTWGILASGFQYVWKVVVNPRRPNTLLLASTNGVYQSYNGGSSFTQCVAGKSEAVRYLPGDTTGVLAYVVQPAPSSTFPNGNYASYVWKSTDGGRSFARKATGWFNFDATRKYVFITGDIAVSPANPNRVYALLACNEQNPNSGTVRQGDVGVLRSDDAGETWAFTKGPWQLPNLMTFGFQPNNYIGQYWQGDYNNWLVVNPLNADQVMLGAMSGYKSVDAGQTWVRVTGYSGLYDTHPDHQGFFLQGNTLWICNDGGILKSTDFVSSQPVPKSRGILASEFWGFGSGFNEDILTGGRYHNGNAARYLPGYAPGVFLSLGGSENPTGYVSPYENKLYHSDIEAAAIPTVLPGQRSSLPNLSKFPAESYGFNASSDVIYHPNQRKTLYLGSGTSLWRSTDDGASFTALAGFPANVLDIAQSLVHPDSLYVCTDANDGHVWRSGDGGVSFTDITAGLPAGSKALTGNALASREAYVLQTGTGNVYRSTDAGQSWTNIGGGAVAGKNGATLLVQASRTDPTCYLFCHSQGVYYRNAATGGSWLPLLDGLPARMQVRKVVAHYHHHQLILGSSGLGVWANDLVGTTPVFANFAVDKSLVRCTRDTVRFYDRSIVDETSGVTRSWSFPGSSGVFGTSRQPKVLYNVPGPHPVTLTVTDGLGNSHSRTLPDIITLQDDICQPEGVPGRALTTNTASATRLDLGPVPLQSNTYTLSVWVKPAGLQKSFSQLLSTSAPNSVFSLGFAFQGYTPNLQLAYSDASSDPNNNTNTSITLDADQWNYITLVYTPTGVTLYKNGQAPGWSYTTGAFPIKNFTAGPVHLNADAFGQGGNFKGDLDEVCFYSRALSLADIREQMHLTKQATTPGLVKYVQFNQYNAATSEVYDAIGSAASAVPAALLTSSNAPVGAGTVATLDGVSSGGTYTFPGTGLNLTFPATGTYPQGTLVGFRLQVPPDTNPSPNSNAAFFPKNTYFIVSNYGVNATFSPLTSLQLTALPNGGTAYNNTDFTLYKRPSVASGATWGSAQAVSDQVTNRVSDLDVSFSAGNNITSFSQLMLTAPPGPLALIRADLTATVLAGPKVRLVGTGAVTEGLASMALEKSADGIRFAPLKTVPGAGSSVQTLSYVDAAVEAGRTTYYRLLLAELGGKHYYSPIKAVLPTMEATALKVYPNPVGSWLLLHYTGNPTAGMATIFVYSAIGQLVLKLAGVSVKAGSTDIACNASGLPAGHYTGTFQLAGEGPQTFRFVKAE